MATARKQPLENFRDRVMDAEEAAEELLGREVTVMHDATTRVEVRLEVLEDLIKLAQQLEHDALGRIDYTAGGEVPE